MTKKLIILIALFLWQSYSVYSQTLREAKAYFIKKTDLPENTQIVNGIMCKSLQPVLYYRSPDMYRFITASGVIKSYQSFRSTGEYGSILYFQYKKTVPAGFRKFLAGLLYGRSGKPTKSHEEEFRIKDNLVIIWCLYGSTSRIKSVSKLRLNLR